MHPQPNLTPGWVKMRAREAERMHPQPNLTPGWVKMRQKEEQLKRRGTTKENGRRVRL